MTDETQQNRRPQRPLDTLGEGLRTGVGVLNAFREALQETVTEAMEGGEMSPEGARKLMKDAADRVQHSLEDARERLDWVTHRELDELRREVAELRGRVATLEGRADAGGDAADAQDAGGAPDSGIIVVPE
jgi:polyhydroxyalkanoate synthesis regulator phasin